jgi:hypothetical protein
MSNIGRGGGRRVGLEELNPNFPGEFTVDRYIFDGKFLNITESVIIFEK